MNQAEAVQFLQDITRIKTENDNEAEVARYIQKLLADHGIDSKMIELSPGRSNLVAEISNGEGKVLGISGHMDVVAAGDASLWSQDPYGAAIVDGKMYGRGTSDMKSGLAALIIAMIDAKEKGNYQGTIRLLATVGEESGEAGARQLSDMGYGDDLDAVLVAEPFNGRILYAHGGSYNYTMKSYGVACHSSSPHLGQNAIHHLRDAMVAVQAAVDEIIEKYENPKLKRTLHNVTWISGGAQINSLPAYAQYQANMRTIPEFGNDQVTALLQSVVDELNKREGFKLELEVIADMPPVESNPESDLIKVIHENSHESNLELICLPGTTDTAQLRRRNKTMDIAMYGPGNFNVIHKIDEHIEVDQYLQFIETFKRIIPAYLK